MSIYEEQKTALAEAMHSADHAEARMEDLMREVKQLRELRDFHQLRAREFEKEVGRLREENGKRLELLAEMQEVRVAQDTKLQALLVAAKDAELLLQTDQFVKASTFVKIDRLRETIAACGEEK